MNEQAVFVTPDGLGRASVIRRDDGLFQIYEHWIWSDETRRAFNVAPGGRTSWFGDKTPTELLYQEVEPQPGLFGSLADAIRHLQLRAQFTSSKRVK